MILLHLMTELHENTALGLLVIKLLVITLKIAYIMKLIELMDNIKE